MEKKYHGLVPPIVTPVLENEDVKGTVISRGK